MSIAPGNKTHIFPSIPPNSTEARENEIVSRTQSQMFSDHGIDNPATTYGGGIRNAFGAMTNLDGKTIQETYRDGLPRSRSGHDGVADR